MAHDGAHVFALLPQREQQRRSRTDSIGVRPQMRDNADAVGILQGSNGRLVLLFSHLSLVFIGGLIWVCVPCRLGVFLQLRQLLVAGTGTS